MSFLGFLKDPIGSINAWFHKQEASAEKLLRQIAPYVQTAEDYAGKLQSYVGDIAKLSQDARVAKVAGFLGTVIQDTVAVQSFATANANALLSNLTHNAVVFATAHVHNVVVTEALHVLDTAVQFAFSTVKVSTGASSASTAASLAQKPF